jgi:hypothetical protein
MVVIPSQWLSMKGMMSMSLENMVLGFPSLMLACIKLAMAVMHIWGKAEI